MPSSNRSKHGFVTASGPVLALLLLVNGPGAARQFPALEDQHFTIVFGFLNPGIPPLQIHDFDLKALLTDEDRTLLVQSLGGGEIRISGGSASNPFGLVSPRARMIVLFTGPLEQPVTLRQPDAANVLYVQDGQTFAGYPSETPLLNRVVEFVPTDPVHIRYFVERATGRSGGTVGLPMLASPGGSSAAARQPARAGGSVIPPTKRKDVAPIHPAPAIAAGVYGAVVLEILVDATGKVSEARVIRSQPLLDQAAIDCVRQWEFTPALLNGAATSMRMAVTVEFPRP